MTVEIADQVFRVADRETVMADDVQQGIGQGALAGALAALEHNRDLALLGGELQHASHPTHEIAEPDPIAIADDPPDVVAQQAPVTWHRLDRIAFPEIEHAILDFPAVRVEHDTVNLLPALGMAQPDVRHLLECRIALLV